MSEHVRGFARRGLWLLPIWAAMLFLGTLTHQPDPQTQFGAFAAYVTTTEFLVSHLVNSILGAALGSIGAVALLLYLSDRPVAKMAAAGAVASVAANTLNTAVFGVAAFAQPALGRAFLSGQESAQDLYSMIYAAPLFGTAILGLLLQIVGGVFLGIGIASSGRFPRWAGWLYAAMTTALSLSLLYPASQSVITALLFVATLAVAWTAQRRGLLPEVPVGIAPEP